MHPVYTFLLADNGTIRSTKELRVVSRNVLDDVTYITAENFEVYREFPLLNALTGVQHRLWLKPTEMAQFNIRNVQQRFGDLDPGVLSLHKIGICAKDPNDPLFGYLSPGSKVHIIVDQSGGFWIGAGEDALRPIVRPYVHETPSWAGPMATPHQELRFMYPRLERVKSGGWWHDPHAGVLQKVLICTHDVMKVIQDLGMFEHYWPSGPAMTDPGLARAEAEKVRNTLVGPVLAEAAKLRKDNLDLKGEVEVCLDRIENLNLEVQNLKTENTRLKSIAKEQGLLIQVLEKQPSVPKRRTFNPLWEMPD